MALEALLRGWVSRALPQAETDNDPGVVRLARYGEIYAISHVRKQHTLVDEGSYFVTNNAQSGIITSNLGTAFAATTLSPTLIITNSDSPTNSNSKRIHIDWMHLVVTSTGGAGAGLTNLNFAWTVDGLDRYSSGGTDLTGSIVSPNMDVARNASVARVRFGALTLNAASGNARTLLGQRQMRQQNSATVMCVLQDHTLFTFGNVEPNHGPQVDLSTAKTSAGTWTFMVPAITIGPNQCAIFHLWSPGAALTTGITFLPELAWWER
jgi:hypothetical protein